MFDFYYMHCVNSSVFFPAFMALPSLSDADKCRLLEWKGRLDLAMYASRHSPTPRLDDITGYRSAGADGKQQGWEDVFARIRRFEDDGHASKLVRAVANGQKVSAPYEGQPGFRVGGETWERLGLAVVDSVELPGENWVRSAGFDEAWKDVKNRPTAQL